jgi:drug/metabolite transporter (DMT)-like permease
MFLYLEPITTLLAALILLHEIINVTNVLGGVIIIVGVVIVNGQMLPSLFRLFIKTKE